MTEPAGIEAADPGVVYQGVIALEWPPPRPGCAPIPGWGVSVFDAISGRQITTVTRLTICAATNDAVTAVLTMFASPDGQPLYSGNTVYPDDDGGVLTGTWPFLVGEMRVRQPDRTLEPAET